MALATLDEQTKAFVLSDDRVFAFLTQLSTHRSKTVKSDDLWRYFTLAYPDGPQGVQRRQWLSVLLDELDRNEDLKLPSRKGKLWDTSSSIPLPRQIVVNSQADTPADQSSWRSFPWHPSLQWVLQRRWLRTQHVTFLQRVHQGLCEGWFESVESLKYRSLQLTGDEKKLEKLLRTKLFGPGKLSIELLACQPEMLPLATHRISDVPSLLIFENAQSFLLARDVSQSINNPRYGLLGYGAGKQVIKSLDYFSTLAPPVTEIFYIGDLDAEGISVAAKLQRLSSVIPISPATAFHQAMLHSAKQLGSPNGWPAKDGQAKIGTTSALAFLDATIRTRCRALIEQQRRIPEEAITRSMMRELLTMWQ
ncbi:hypothetical protein [Rhodopirellula europaea]|uniref:hypothetical protein n=1 Tax=Rhodopirellula europaea TaxID=1263866 RepID=UPI003D2AED03|tara:strand:+ start:43580 stop:44671 length:1092 start_codon:yes stop_codon:yes gene_type:complete